MPRPAAIPSKRGKPFAYPSIQVLNPGKGLNNLVSDSLIDDREASDLNNIQFVESGCVSKATGKAVWGSGLTTTPKGLGTFYPDSGSRVVLTIDDTALKSTTSASATWTSISGATFTTGQNTTFTQYRTLQGSTGKAAIFIWNGTDGGTYYDGTTLSRPGTMPSASFSIIYQGFHIAAGTGTNTSRLYISDIQDATQFTRSTFPASPSTPPLPDNTTDVPGATVAGSSARAQLVDVNPRDGDKITGLAKFKDILVIFKERAIYQFAFDASGNPIITPIITYLGAVSHRSIDNVDNDVFYLSRLGWFVLGYEPNFFTIIRTNELSARIHPLLDSINSTNLTKVASLYKPYRFYSSFPSGGSSTNNLTVTYDKRYLGWSKIDFIHASAFTVFIDGSNNEHLLFAADDESQVYELDSSYSNSGSAIDAYWQSKAFDGGQPSLYKRWIFLDLFFRQISGTITITVYADSNTLAHTSTISPSTQNGGIGLDLFGGAQFGDSPNATASSSTDTTTTTNVPYRIRLSTVSRSLKVKIENANLNETFVLLGLKLHYRPYSIFKYPSSLKIQ